MTGPCSLSCHGDTMRQWYCTDFRISLHNPASNCAACQGRGRANRVCGRMDGCMCMLLWRRTSGREKKTEIKRGWEGLGLGEEIKEGGKRMTGEEWVMETMSGKCKLTRLSRSLVHEHPPAEMTGVRMCEWAGWACGRRRDAATVQFILLSVWSLHLVLTGFPLHYFQPIHTAPCRIHCHHYVTGEFPSNDF